MYLIHQANLHKALCNVQCGDRSEIKYEYYSTKIAEKCTITTNKNAAEISENENFPGTRWKSMITAI